MSSQRHSSRISSYSKITVGSVAAIGATASAEAAVIYFDVNPDRLLEPGDSASFGNINLSTVTYDSSTTSPAFTLSNPIGVLDASGFSIDLTGVYLTPFYSGYLISSSLDWVSAPSVGAGVPEGQTRYFGLRMDVGDGNYNYGWVSVTGSVNALSGFDYTVNAFAFEGDINTPIEAGAVPEPSTYALLALAGLFGAAVWHHRRQKVGAPTELLQLAAGARGVEQLRSDRKS